MNRKIIIMALFSLFFLSSLSIHAQEGYVSVPAAAFKGSSDMEDYNITTYTDDNWPHYVKMRSTGAVLAPVNFPIEGVQVKSMRVTLYDDTDWGEVGITLFRVSLWSGNQTKVFDVWSGDIATPGLVRMSDWTGKARYVDNSKYAWFIMVWFAIGNQAAADNLRFYGVKIKYK